jgi:RNA polymerase II subunit A small phosphatase-like protein
LGKPPADKANLKTLVLDLDETLVHSAFKKPKQNHIQLPVQLEGETYIVYVLCRPGYL